jgi:hypothetical protein
MLDDCCNPKSKTFVRIVYERKLHVFEKQYFFLCGNTSSYHANFQVILFACTKGVRRWTEVERRTDHRPRGAEETIVDCDTCPCPDSKRPFADLLSDSIISDAKTQRGIPSLMMGSHWSFVAGRRMSGMGRRPRAQWVLRYRYRASHDSASAGASDMPHPNNFSTSLPRSVQH